MNLQPTLENKLIQLRPLRESDFEDLYKAAKDPLIWEQHPSKDRYKREIYAEYFKDSLASEGALIVIDLLSNQIIGSSRFEPIPNIKNAIEIGWSFLSRDYWGGKYNQSVKKLMIEYALKTVENVIFYIGKENIRSQKAVEKIGGKRIVEIELQHLIRKNEEDWTYLITK